MSLLIDVVKTVKGKDISKASPELQEKRKSICADCELYKDGKCGSLKGTLENRKEELGCGCPIEDKVKYVDEHCPRKKW